MQKEAKTLIAIGSGILVVLIGVFLWYQQQKVVTKSEPVDGNKLIRSDSQIIGKTDAPNTIVEFGDFQCPACASVHPIIKKIIADNPDKLRFVFRNFPLSQHKNGYPSSQAAEAAAKQGKYAEMFDLLYTRQGEWIELPDPQAKFEEFARLIDLNVEKFRSDYKDPYLRVRIQVDVDDGNSLGVNSTPTLYLNGEKLSGFNLGNLQSEIESRINKTSESTDSVESVESQAEVAGAETATPDSAEAIKEQESN